jgi:hypothetical protein
MTKPDAVNDTKVLKLRVCGFVDPDTGGTADCPRWVFDSASRFKGAWDVVAAGFSAAIKTVKAEIQSLPKDADGNFIGKLPDEKWAPLNEMKHHVENSRAKDAVDKKGNPVRADRWLMDVMEAHKLNAEEGWYFVKTLKACMKNRRTRKLGWDEGFPRRKDFQPFVTHRWVPGKDYALPSNLTFAENSIRLRRALEIAPVGKRGRSTLYRISFKDVRGAFTVLVSDRYDLLDELRDSYLVFLTLTGRPTPTKKGYVFDLSLTLNRSVPEEISRSPKVASLHLGWRKQDTDVNFALSYDPTINNPFKTYGLPMGRFSEPVENWERSHGMVASWEQWRKLDEEIGARLQACKNEMARLGGCPVDERFWKKMRDRGLKRILVLNDPETLAGRSEEQRGRLEEWGRSLGLKPLTPDQFSVLRDWARKNGLRRQDRWLLIQHLEAKRRELYYTIVHGLCREFGVIHLIDLDLKGLAETEGKCECKPERTLDAKGKPSYRTKHVEGCLKQTAIREAQKQRQWVSLFGFKSILKQIAPEYGTAVIDCKPEDAPTITCSGCGSKMAVGSSLMVTCGNCGFTHNQDENAAVNQLRFSSNA